MIIGNEVLPGTPNSGGRALDERVRQGRYDARYRPRAAGLLYDVLKFQNLFEGAAHMVDRYPTLPTLRGWGPFLDAMAASQGWDWVAGMFEDERPHAGMQRWMDRLIIAWRVSLLRTGETLPQISGLDLAFNEADAALRDDTELGPNERESRTLQWLRDNDLDRVAVIRNSRVVNLAAWRQEHRTGLYPCRWSFRAWLPPALLPSCRPAWMLWRPLRALATSPIASTSRACWRKRRAADLLARSLDAVAQFQTRYSRENIHARLEEPFTPDPTLAREAGIERLRRTLEEQARAFFALNRPAAGQPRTIETMAPTLAQIVERSGLMRTALRGVAPLLENRSVELFAAEQPDEALLDNVLFLRAWLDLMAGELKKARNRRATSRPHSSIACTSPGNWEPLPFTTAGVAWLTACVPS